MPCLKRLLSYSISHLISQIALVDILMRGCIPDYEGRAILSTSSFAETIKVYDGYNSLRKRTFRTITVNKHCSKDELLLAAMRAFVVTQVSQ